jgi:sigma-B regulation protein RsbU (phosphoserine phosphatase)
MSSQLKKNIAIRIKDIKLNSLLEITKAINHNFSTEQLLEIFEEVLETKLKIVKLALFSNSENGWKCILKYGVGEEYKEINVERDLLPIQEIGPINFSETSLNKLFDVVIPVFHKSQPLAYALIGDSEYKVELSPSYKHLNFVQTLTSIIAVAIENKKLAKENIRQAGMKKELELGSEMQSMLFPATLPNNSKIDTAAFYLPHQQVGGDYYDFNWLNENECAFCIADVSGKGIAAALLMSNFQANLRILFKRTSSLTKLVRILNTIVMETAKGEKFITFFIAKYNFLTHTLTYINAAHNPPILATKNSMSLLKTGCIGLGMFNRIENIEEGKINITPDTTIVCYTDGLVELENEKGADFGIDRLKKVIQNNPDKGMTNLNNLIVKSFINFKQSKPYVDDIALFSIKIH